MLMMIFSLSQVLFPTGISVPKSNIIINHIIFRISESAVARIRLGTPDPVLISSDPSRKFSSREKYLNQILKNNNACGICTIHRVRKKMFYRRISCISYNFFLRIKVGSGFGFSLAEPDPDPHRWLMPTCGFC